MSLIKLLLLAGVGAFGLLAYRGARTAGHRVLWRAGGLGAVAAAVLSVAFPDSLTAFARLLGVGRGADLVLYSSVIVFLLVAVAVFRRINELEARCVALARALAIHEAHAEAGNCLPASRSVFPPSMHPEARTGPDRPSEAGGRP